MATRCIIRLDQDDKQSSPILVKISHKDGGHKLDLDLLATDGDAAYIGKGNFVMREIASSEPPSFSDPKQSDSEG